jgi:Mor family transcriptional regulator
MLRDWNALSDDLQLALSAEALRRAAETIAGQAEVLAAEMENGGLLDRGGPDALRLLAHMVRAAGDTDMRVAGHA